MRRVRCLCPRCLEIRARQRAEWIVCLVILALAGLVGGLT